MTPYPINILMKLMIQKIESRFENMGRWIHIHPKRVILVMLLFFASLASNLPSIQVDTSTEAFFSENDQTRIAYDNFREQFGRDEIVLALIHPKKVFDINFLNLVVLQPCAREVYIIS